MIRPLASWQQGFARNQFECPAKFRSLWKGLVGAWVPALGPTGSRLVDVGSNKFHGTFTSIDPSTDWIVSDLGYALNFDGVDDRIAAGTFTVTTGVISIVVRVTYDAFPDEDPRIVIKGDTFPYRWSLDSEDTTSEVKLRINTGTLDSIQGGTIVFGTRTHVVGTYDGSNMRLYQDAVQVATAAKTGALLSSTEGVYFGGGIDADRYFDGKISEIRIYNRPLQVAEIELDSANPLGWLKRRRRSVASEIAVRRRRVGFGAGYAIRL
jgi:hypothetical protein